MRMGIKQARHNRGALRIQSAAVSRGKLFDVILVDGPDPVGIAEGLFESPFYQSCRACLQPEGVLASQTEAPFVMHDSFVRIVKTLGNVFKNVRPYFGQVPIYPCGNWSWTFASDAIAPDLSALVTA